MIGPKPVFAGLQAPARAARSALAAVMALSAALVAVVAAGLAVAPPASAVEPTGGCWVWYAGDPSSNISTSLAPWTDTAASPAGPADHTLTLSPPSPAPGETVTATYGFNKGPKNAGPAANVTGTFSFSVNGETITATKSYGTVGGGATIPATSVTAQFVAVEGDNTVTLTSAVFKVPAPFLVQIDCNGQSAGNATTNPRTTPLPTNITASVTGAGPSVTPSLTASASPSESTSATASATGSATASTSPSEATSTATSNPGSPAKGTSEFACTLDPLGTDFDYSAKMTVSGYRAHDGDPVTLAATMSDLPGIAPLPIDGHMDVTLDLELDGAAVTLEGGESVTAAAKQPVPVPNLAGEVEHDADEAEVMVTGFTFNFAELSVGADCTASQAMGKMTIGSEPPVGSTGGTGGSGGTSGGTSSGGGVLPKTGGLNSLPVLALLAGALILFGSAGVVLVPIARPKGEHV
ncbi:hypothetical protein [Nocardioides sp.]|uniref:hypothetical protein n=1 Tax=Nocardioides sp. TaxID=35761 RepID=UPI003567EAE0